MKIKSKNSTHKEKDKLKRNILKNWELYLLLIIPLIFILIFNYYPMLGLQIAFKKYSPSAGIWGGEFVGLANFMKLFRTPKFAQVFSNTMKLSVYQALVEPIVNLVFALLINAVFSKKYKKTVQMVTYMPHFISTVVMVNIFMQVLNSKIGLYAKVCEFIGVKAVDIWSKPQAFPHLFVWSLIWQNVGWNSVIYIAALAGVDMNLYEAAKIDGASRFKQLIDIDFPVILPTFVILFILKIGSMMSIGYERVLLMQNLLNLRASEIISTYSYKVALGSSADYSYGTAIGLFNSVINLILIYAANKVSSRVTEVSLW